VLACFHWLGLETSLAEFDFAHCLFMRESDADWLLSQAQECLQEAERTRNPLDKEAWLRLAEDWMKLAQAAKDRNA
jgi:hypothetical protein